jgi:hypothetical protein
MRIRFQTDIRINVKAIVKDSIIHLTEDEMKRDIRSIFDLWAKQRLRIDGWPIPNNTENI